ncbi:MAG: tetratricopeptide repeat protein [Promethearchaeota archaeon]
MKPFGTITMYYPFIDKDIVTQIDEIMKISDNYYDFVLKISERACKEENPTHLTYFAAIHAWKLSATVAKLWLLQNFGDHLIIKSFATPLYQMGVNTILDCIEEAIKETEETWLRIELLCLKEWYARYHIGGLELAIEPMERAESIIENHSEFECLGSLVHAVRSDWSFSLAEYDRAYESHNKGMEIAQKYSDQFHRYHLLWIYSSWLKSLEPRKALVIQEDAYKLAKKFGSPQKIAEAMVDMGRISEFLGEYDLAIELYKSGFDTYGSPGMEIYRELLDTPSFGLARVYCELEDGNRALEWIETAIRIVDSALVETPYVYAIRAEALILLKQYQDAAHQLEIGQKIALKSGDVGHMSFFELAIGNLERIQGNPLAAILTLEPGYDHLSQYPAAIYINRFLIALVRAEVEANLKFESGDISEKWMMKLEDHAREKDLPGILMLHALLKSDYLIARGLRKEAIEILSESLNEEFSDTTKTLYERVKEKIIRLQTVTGC